MFKRFMTKKALVLLAVAAVAVSASVGAYAYFSSSGSGTGSATVGTTTAATITATVTPGTGGLVPGGNAASVAFSILNNGSGNEFVHQLTLTSVAAYPDSGHTTAGDLISACSSSWFSMTAVTVDHNIAGGATYTGAPNGSLNFNDSGGNQDACAGKYIVATFGSN